MDAQGQRCGAEAEAALDDENESLITEILTIPLPKPVDTSVPCLISWAGDDIDRGDYEPVLVRIGPFHRQDPTQQSADGMEQQKKQVLRGLLVSREEDEAGRREELRSYLEAMERVDPDARRCYNRTFSWMSSKEFARMLLLDGFFLYSRFVVAGAGDDDIAVDRDVVFLLENQIPFFVLEEIHRLLTRRRRSEKVLPAVVVLDKVAGRVEQLLRRNGYSNSAATSSSSPTPPCHLLHLLYMHLSPTTCAPKRIELPQVQHNNGEYRIRVPVPQVRWRTATQYAAAGVRLVKRNLDGEKARSILDVELTGEDTLQVPCLTVDSNTFRMLRNMVAMEQKSLQKDRRTSHVTAYCLFISQLATTEEDVALLVSNGVIVHLLHSDDEVAAGLAGLCDGVVIDAYDPDGNYLRPKYEALERLISGDGGGGGRRKYSMARLRRHGKRSNCLMALMVMAAVFLFLWTAQQSVFAALRAGKGRC